MRVWSFGSSSLSAGSHQSESVQVDVVCEAVQAALACTDFPAAERLLAQAHAEISHPELWLLSGQTFLFQGKVESAIDSYQRAWELSRTQPHPNTRWRACLGLFIACREAGDLTQAEQMFQQGVSSAMFSLRVGHLDELPDEALLAMALREKAPTFSQDAIARLQWLQCSSASPDIRARASLELAEDLGPVDGLENLLTGCRNFQQAGNIAGVLRCLELLAEWQLSSEDWKSATASLEQAKQIARTCGMQPRVTRYAQLVRRMHRSLALLDGPADLN